MKGPRSRKPGLTAVCGLLTLALLWSEPSRSASAQGLGVPGLTAPPNSNSNSTSSAAKKDLYLDYDFELGALLEVATVDTTRGAIQVKCVGEGHQFPATFTEGYYFLLPDFPKDDPLAETPPVYRAQATEIGENGYVTLQVGTSAAEKIRAGERFHSLARPEGATTRQIMAFPEVIHEDKSAQDSKKRLQEIRKFMEQATGSIANLKKIGDALAKYEKEQGYYPPAIVNGPDGKPWHSWRVLILPYLGQKDLYDSYDFAKPWNDPQNLELLDRMPSVYRDPAYQDKLAWYTHYVVLSGEKTAFRPEGVRMNNPEALKRSKKPYYELSLEQRKGLMTSTRVQDDKAGTLAVVPAGPSSKILWTKPEDLAATGNESRLNQLGVAAPYRFEDSSVAPVLLFDGTVRMLKDTVDSEVLAAMQTIAGGETVEPARIPFVDMPSMFKGKKSIVLRIGSSGPVYVVEDRRPPDPSSKRKDRMDSAVFPVRHNP